MRKDHRDRTWKKTQPVGDDVALKMEEWAKNQRMQWPLGARNASLFTTSKNMDLSPTTQSTEFCPQLE